MKREVNILTYTVSCKYCGSTIQTTSTSKLARFGRDHRTHHLGPRPNTPEAWA